MGSVQWSVTAIFSLLFRIRSYLILILHSTAVKAEHYTQYKGWIYCLGGSNKLEIEWFLIVLRFSEHECNNTENRLFLVCMGTPWNPKRPAGVPQTAMLGISGQGCLHFFSDLECDCLITAFVPRGAAVECRVINPICTLVHMLGV